MANGRRVLVVDGLSETEEVLRAVLGSRGLDVSRVRGDLNGPAPLDEGDSPSLIVLHEDKPPRTGTQDETGSRWRHVPRIIIGSAEFVETGRDAGGTAQHHIRQPFHYGELIAAIERLLSNGDAKPAGEWL